MVQAVAGFFRLWGLKMLLRSDSKSSRSLLKIGLETIACLTGDQVDVAHVSKQIDAGNAHLLVDDDLSGFVIVKFARSIMSGDVELYVLAAYKHGGDGMQKYDSEIKALAENAGAKRVVFQTKRPGLVRKAKSFNYQQGSTVMSKEI